MYISQILSKKKNAIIICKSEKLNDIRTVLSQSVLETGTDHRRNIIFYSTYHQYSLYYSTFKLNLSQVLEMLILSLEYHVFKFFNNLQWGKNQSFKYRLKDVIKNCQTAQLPFKTKLAFLKLAFQNINIDDSLSTRHIVLYFPFLTFLSRATGENSIEML